ncbi:unnamed protein product [Closterium sp. NIES-53]
MAVPVCGPAVSWGLHSSIKAPGTTLGALCRQGRAAPGELVGGWVADASGELVAASCVLLLVGGWLLLAVNSL